MLSSPQQSRLASRHCSDFWEPNPRQRSHSLNPIVLRLKSAASDSEEQGNSSKQKAKTSPSVKTSAGGKSPATPRQRKSQKAFVPDLLNPPACLSSLPHQRRKNLRQCSLSGLDSSKPDPDTNNQTKKTPDTVAPKSRAPNTRAKTVDRLPSINHPKTVKKVRHKFKDPVRSISLKCNHSF